MNAGPCSYPARSGCTSAGLALFGHYLYLNLISLSMLVLLVWTGANSRRDGLRGEYLRADEREAESGFLAFPKPVPSPSNAHTSSAEAH
jgi:hypothetical protein